MNEVPEDRMEALREQARQGLQYLLNFLFANAEQALIGMAAKSDSNAGQSSCYEAMRERILKRQKEIGWVPQATELTRRVESMPACNGSPAGLVISSYRALIRPGSPPPCSS